jgi:DNA-binding IclR family transcriptional regulator
LANVLATFGLLQQDERTQKYVLGSTIATLGKAVEVSQNEQLAQLAQPYLDSLRDSVRESVCLEVLIPSGHVKLICGAVGPPPLSVTFPESLPTHTAAGAKVILAYSGHELSHPDSKVLNEQLEEIRQRGVAYDHGEADAEVHTVSVAVFNRGKKPVAALSICVPANRVHKILDSKNVNLLKTTAVMISGRCPSGVA